MNITNQMFYGKQDLLFSYGPLYWLLGGASSIYNVFIYWLAPFFSSMISAIFWAITFTLIYNARTYILFFILFFLFFSKLHFSAVNFLWPFIILSYLEYSAKQKISLGLFGFALLGFLTGLFFYIRFFYGLVCLVSIGSYLFSQLIIKRNLHEIVTFSLSSFISYVIFGLFIFHDNQNVINYILINNQLSFGNSIDMTLGVTNSRNTFIASLIIWISLNIYVFINKRNLILTVNILLLIFFKLGFSRADHYLSYFVVPVAILSLIIIFDKNKFNNILFIPILISLYYISTSSTYPHAKTLNGLVPRVDFNLNYNQRMKEKYKNFKLDSDFIRKIGNSKVDVYPYNNEYIFANNLNYWHRPLFQNYMTLTPTLDLMNQKFFESSERPRFIIWTAGMRCKSQDCNPFDGFDQKYSLNEDPLTTSTILLNYHIIDKTNGRKGIPIILLEENSEYINYSYSNISEELMKFGKWYKIPKSSIKDEGIIKLIPDLQFSFWGRLKNMLFRGSVLNIKYKLNTGLIREYRLNILNARNGIWVSPLLEDFHLNGSEVDSIMFETKSSNYFKPTFNSLWIKMQVPGIQQRKIIFDDVISNIPNIKNEIVDTCKGNIDSINGYTVSAPQININSILRIRGWLANSTENGSLPEKTYVTLTDKDGNKLFFLPKAEERKDVVNAFNRKNLLNSGFESLIDISNLKGTYKLGLASVKNSDLHICKQFSIPISIQK